MEYQAEKSCDLIVIGAGGSGVVAAARAAYLGVRRIIVLEKTKTVGGAALFASTFRTFRSKWQQKRNIPDQMDSFIRQGMDATYWKLDPQLVRNCCLATGQYFDWFCEVAGPGMEDEFEEGFYVFDGPAGQHGPELKGSICHRGGGLMMMQRLHQYCLAQGVEILTLHRASDAEVTGEKISAVLADGPDGPVRIHCKACILACGSWVRNDDVVRKVLPEFLDIELDSSCAAHCRDIYTGDGIPLAQKAGAHLDYDNFVLRLMGPCVLSASEVLNHMGNSPYIIGVNLHGKRWACEPVQRRMGLFKAGHALIEQPKGLSYCIFDKNNLEAAIADSKKPKSNDGGFFGHATFPATMEETLEDIERAISRHDGSAYQADSLTDLAGQIGIDPAALVETVDRYNAACARGYDDDFLKAPGDMVPLIQPPYFAVRGRTGSDGAFGGVLVNPDMQAYKEGGGLVEGLYVTGDFASGRFIRLGTYKEQVLNDCSWAFASGYLAANSAASYLDDITRDVKSV